MLLRQLKYFTTVVKDNSFTDAAEECYISQSAISQQIQALESNLGVQLIIRKSRSFSLTPAGDYLYRQSILLLDEVERIKEETTRIGGISNRGIRIGYLNGYNGQELGQAIADFAELYPNMDIQVISGSHEELRMMLMSNELDLTLNDQRRAFSEEFVNYHLDTCCCSIAVSKRSSFASLEKVTAEELKRVPCILISSREQQSNEVDFYRSYLGFSGMFIFAESREEAQLMVSANKGFLLVQMTKNAPCDGVTLAHIPLYRDNNLVERSYYAFWKKERTSSEIEIFARMLHEKF